jgi:uncharacterized protein YndB with AHSA1/START domain
MKPEEPTAALRIVLRRTYAARREKVFRAWTDPGQVVKWMSPSEGVSAEFAEFDLRVGGPYRIGYRTPKGTAVVGGVFMHVEAPAKLVYTWVWEPPNENAGAETLVTVELFDKDGVTELVLTHERFPSSAMGEKHEHGWTGVLESLAAFVGGPGA